MTHPREWIRFDPPDQPPSWVNPDMIGGIVDASTAAAPTTRIVLIGGGPGLFVLLPPEEVLARLADLWPT